MYLLGVGSQCGVLEGYGETESPIGLLDKLKMQFRLFENVLWVCSQFIYRLSALSTESTFLSTLFSSSVSPGNITFKM